MKTNKNNKISDDISSKSNQDNKQIDNNIIYARNQKEKNENTRKCNIEN